MGMIAPNLGIPLLQVMFSPCNKPCNHVRKTAQFVTYKLLPSEKRILAFGYPPSPSIPISTEPSCFQSNFGSLSTGKLLLNASRIATKNGCAMNW
jgi:hypothetical protein